MKLIVVGSSKNKFLSLNNIREKFIVDEKHEGDNIDFLNPWYCELTGLYYLWMQRGDVEEIVGLEHYRRYFINKNSNNILEESEIEDLLKDCDVICRKYDFGRNTPYSMLFSKLRPHVDKFTECIEDRKFAEWYKHELQNSHDFCQCNMFICRRKLMNAYCEMLFNTLAKMPLEFKNCPRSIGYIGEFFMGFWFKYHNYKIKYNIAAEYDKTVSRVVKKF